MRKERFYQSESRMRSSKSNTTGRAFGYPAGSAVKEKGVYYFNMGGMVMPLSMDY